MKWEPCSCLSSSSFAILFFFLTLSIPASFSAFISGGVFGFRASTGRSLLQSKTHCTVDFEALNYTTITRKCKGPLYPADACCGALRDFACPYADVINDLTNDCASTMFSYINLYGKYPHALFSSECRDNSDGLGCPATSPAQSSGGNRNEITSYPWPLLMLTAGFLTLFWLS